MMILDTHTFSFIAFILGFILSENVRPGLCSPKRGVSLSRTSYSLPHSSSSMVTSNYRKTQSFQQNYKRQQSNVRSLNDIQILTDENMNLKLATTALEAALKEAKKNNLKMNIAIVDSGTHLVSFARMDDSLLGSVDVSIKKAKTAALFKAPTGEIGKLSKPDGPIYGVEQTNGGLITFPGGLPIINANGKLIGAIGVSGDSVANDEKVAEAGRKSIQ